MGKSQVNGYKKLTPVNTTIPDIVIGRLPIYLRALTYMVEEGKATTSSQELGRRLGISSAQIRKDLSTFGEFGKQGTGYHIGYLIDQLRQILKLEEEWKVAVVGAGFLGHALTHYNGFQHRGFIISWIFDSDPQKIGQVINGLKVQMMDELEETIRKEGTKMAILAVPAAAAQAVTDRMVEAGIRAILSYAPINLSVPPYVQVRYSDPVIQMQHMAYYLD
ncbi:MAG: redox-sensing transcriptional repressor Rex [Anaerolineales bacterium]|nr:redox-sensing transcriptional repressor Rex [Anaerolineales bacterium]